MTAGVKPHQDLPRITGMMTTSMNLPANLLRNAAIAITAAIILAAAACAPAADSSSGDASDTRPSSALQSDTAADTTLPQVSGDPTPTLPAPASRDDSVLIGSAAPPIVSPTGWINTEPITLSSLQGNIVLIDFWTYTCVNCLRTLPYIKEWHDKYADQGLVILGIHAPEFVFEKNLDNVRDAVERHDLQYPIIQDNQMATWNAYRNRFWPAKYLIDHTGIIRYTHFGEGAYDETEQVIRDLLAESGSSVDLIASSRNQVPELDPLAFRSNDTGQTRELYAGYRRNFSTADPYIGNSTYYVIPTPDTITTFRDPGDHRNHHLYLQGSWINGVESVTHGRTTKNFEDYVALRFNGRSANVVIDFDQATGPFPMLVTLDDAPIPQALWGADVELDPEGRTIVTIDSPRMYRLVEAPEYGGHELKLSANSDRFSVFAFTFGSYDTGP